MRHQSTRQRRAAAALLAVFALAGASCARGEGETESGADTTLAGGTTAPTETSRLDAAGFGDLENVCQDGDASGATDVGVTDDTIQVGTITDKGFTSRPGLNEEMYDAAVAFAAWCNEHGGINGRELVVADRDAALADFNARIIDACSQDFALVGGGAVLDETDNGGRVACGLPNIAGYVVSEPARSADLQVQPVPNPTGRMAMGAYQVIADQNPDLIDRYGVITSSFGSVLNVRDDTVAAAEELGFTTVYSEEYAPTGESNWRPFVDGLQAADVQVMDFVGEPTFFGQLLESMDQAGYRPEIMIQNANFYDSTFAENAGVFSENVHVRLQYTPFELADENPATSDYLELMERYRPDGKVALLGMQALSAYLLFAQAATACGSELTRTCLLEQAGSVTEWTGGGLHAPQDPASNTPSPCFVILDLTTDGFVVNEDFTAPTDGIFNCEDDNVVDVPVD
jgi:Periplasmic binding protein